jgi:squalene-associated FAD-dependent desaturase
MDDHLSRRQIALSLEQPTRESDGSNESVFSLLGLAPDGVYLASQVTLATGELLPRRFTLTCEFRGRFPFCGTFPDLAAGRRYRPSCSAEPGLSSRSCDPAIVQPTANHDCFTLLALEIGILFGKLVIFRREHLLETDFKTMISVCQGALLIGMIHRLPRCFRMNSHHRRILVLGGGIAGLSAALHLSLANQELESDQQFEIVVRERKRFLGGRAGSYMDSQGEQLIDFCQHVSMGCCTWFQDFCEKGGVDHCFKPVSRLHFFLPQGKPIRFEASSYLPAPFHLALSLVRHRHLSIAERFSIARTLMRLAQYKKDEDIVALEWLLEQGQTDRCIRQFWETFLLSALGERIERVSLIAARKVVVDGFLRNRKGYQVRIPTKSLRQLFDRDVAQNLKRRGIKLERSCPNHRLSISQQGVLMHGENTAENGFAKVVCAVPWHSLNDLLTPPLSQQLPELAGVNEFRASPITGIHLWFDRPITDLPHAVFVGRTSHWLFNGKLIEQPAHGAVADGNSSQSGSLSNPNQAYYQIVISSDIAAAGPLERESILKKVRAELLDCFPQSAGATLLRSQFVTERKAVFSYTPGLDLIRPKQKTSVDNLYLAGDWTDTGWPSTMEGAVRSGYLAADAVLRDHAISRPELPSELKSSWISKRLFGE